MTSQPNRITEFKYRLALDVGIGSLGWCIYRLHPDTMRPVQLVRLGVRIFDSGRDGKTLESRAAKARAHRSMRRTLRRKAARREAFAELLVETGLLPEDRDTRLGLNKLDPYELRARAVHEPLTRGELGRAIFHIARRRGFQSNRKDRSSADGGAYAAAIQRLRDALRREGVATVGEYLAGVRKTNGPTARLRMRPVPVTEIKQRLGELPPEEAKASPVVEAPIMATPHPPATDAPTDPCGQLDMFIPMAAIVAGVAEAAGTGKKKGKARAPKPAKGKGVKEKDGGKEKKPKEEHWFFLDRAMVHHELAEIFRVQRAFHPELLTDQLLQMLVAAIDHRRSLHPVARGTCPFHPDEPREYLASPLQQRFRIYQEAANVRVVSPSGSDRPLTHVQWRALTNRLLASEKVSMAAISALAGIKKGSGERLNFEGGDRARSELLGDKVGVELIKRVGQAWLGMPLPRQVALVDLLLGDDDAQIMAALQGREWGYDEPRATAILQTPLPDKVGRLGRTALQRIIEAWDNSEQVLTYDQAVKVAGYASHSEFYTGEIMDRLPYYGACDLVRQTWCMPVPLARSNASFNPDELKFGRISNPTVHVALNQMRKVVNAIIGRYGRTPDEVVIEVAREVGMGAEKLRAHNKRQRENEARNDALRATLIGMGKAGTAKEMKRQRLWEDAGGAAGKCCCPYSGKTITQEMLHDASAVEVDHILPRSQTHDDGIDNLILCTTEMNRVKRGKSPFEAFGHLPEWEAIRARVERMYPKSRRLQRFSHDAMEKFKASEDWHASALGLTGYFARAALSYMRYVSPRVWPSRGIYTSMLRKELGAATALYPKGDGRKNRDDHRHHALDAAMIGLCDPVAQQALQKAYLEIEEGRWRKSDQGAERRSLIDAPWTHYHRDLEQALARVIVSRKPEHGIEGEIAQAEIYRPQWRPVAKGRGRKRIEELRPFGERVNDAGVTKWRRLHAVRADRNNGCPQYVATDSNHCYDIWQAPSGNWEGRVISTMEAYRRRSDFENRAMSVPDGCVPIMRLHKGDTLRVKIEGKLRIMAVQKFTKGQITLYGHNEANADARNRSKTLDGFTRAPDTLRELSAEVVAVDPMGNTSIVRWRR